MKKTMVIAVACFGVQSVLSQNLFTYGTKHVTKQEFLNAFNKNPVAETERSKALSEYLGLYINYKLKVQAAYDEGLQNQPSIQAESNNFKSQIADNLLNEEANIKGLVTEAFNRSQKDIQAAQIFIEVKGQDTTAAYQQIQQAYTQLKAGANFEEVAANFSTDAYLKQAKGDMGFATVFGFQYQFENQIYQLKPAAFSAPYKSKLGYHIFKNLGERKALGKRKIGQIFIAIPPNASAEEKRKFGALADSVYQLATNGKSFASLAEQFSNDTKTATNGGILPEISVGDFEADFENKIFNLTQIGTINRPFESKYGYHIIKLLEILPIGTNLEDATTYANLKQRVEKDSRLTTAKQNLVKKWLIKTQYAASKAYKPANLWAFTDSVLHEKSPASNINISDSTLLFSFAKQTIKVADWLNFAKQQRLALNNADVYPQEFTAFIQASCTNYYRDHLETYDTKMQQQLAEFNDANLLFSAMDKHVWSKASEDTAGLKTYYATHAAKYQWEEGYSAIVVTCNSQQLVREVAAKLAKNSQDWRAITASYGQDVVADSSRYERKQPPVKQTFTATVGFTSTPEKSVSDDNYTFVIITNAFNKPEPRSFEDARGIVINDYQQVLEEQWLLSLKKKYPVAINNAVWKIVK